MTDDGFSPDEARMLPGLLDEIIPPSADGRLPGAGALDLAGAMARAAKQNALLRPVVEYGLSALAERARELHPAGWTALSQPERARLVAEFTAADQIFLPAFLFLVYGSYYQHPRVLAALGLEARAPHPEGYPMETNDLALLEPVRGRARMYRE